MPMRLGGLTTKVVRRLRSDAGFGLIELLIAMVVTNIAVMALVAALSSSHVALVRASRISTATAIANAQLETYRAGTYAEIALTPAPPAPPPTPVNVTGADGRGYPVTTTVIEICPDGSAPVSNACPSGGRPLKQVTVVVQEPSNSTVLVTESSAYDQLTLG
jgi:Tfp pilus assembly protein PilV